MKFEFDHKTGTMQPKKDDQIYFAKSQGGGLIVDDKKNNVKYIIERDERITKLFGSFDKDGLNFYDMRDARMISDRVIRLFGRDHKYTDYHYFLKGYHMNENFVQKMSDFLDESVWNDIRRRGNGEIKKEEGTKIGTSEDGQPIVLGSSASSDGTLVQFDGEYILRFGNNLYVAIVSDGDTDSYYALDGGMDLADGDGNMSKCFEADSSLREEHDFKPLRALIQSIDNNDTEWDDDSFWDLNVDVRSKWIEFELPDTKYRLFFDRDVAVSYAIDLEENLLDEEKPSEEDIERWRNMFGTGWFDEDWFNDCLQEYYESTYDDLNEEDAIEELLRREIIEDTEEYFDLDEDGEIDHSLPKFDVQDYKDQYVEKRMGEIDDYVEEYIFQLGTEEIENHINTRKLAEKIIETDGPESMIAGYDGVEREEEIDGITYYIYRRE